MTASLSGMSFRRSQIMSTLTLILIWIEAMGIFYMALHDPMFGYANQFDVRRTAACLSLWPDFPDGPRDMGHFAAPIQTHRLVTVASQSCYPSAEVVVDWTAVRLDGVRRLVVGASDVVDTRAIGLFKALLLVATACVVSQSLRRRPAIALVHAATLLLVIADPPHTLYLNRFMASL